MNEPVKAVIDMDGEVWRYEDVLKEGAKAERERLVAALDAYRESIGPVQHYASQQFAMQDAIAYATVFIVKAPMAEPKP